MTEEILTIEDLKDCGGQVDFKHFSAKEKRAMKILEEKGLVALRYVLTAKGKEQIKKPGVY